VEKVSVVESEALSRMKEKMDSESSTTDAPRLMKKPLISPTPAHNEYFQQRWC
jgi:hypothetical protein